MIVNRQKVKEYWSWFLSNKDVLENYSVDKRIVPLIDKHISRLGDYGWEIGPGITKKYSFTISPNSNEKRLKETIEIVELAPKLKDWEFHFAKPPKEFDYKIKLPNKKHQLQIIDGSDWQYVLLQYSDGKFEILIKALNLESFAEDIKVDAIYIMVESIIGEEKLIRFIDYIDLVEDFETEYKKSISSLKVLKTHLTSLLPC